MTTLEVLGMGCRSCVGLLKNTEEAVRQEGRNDTVTKVSDYSRILVLDPWALPALAIDGKVVIAGRIATPAEIRQLLAAESSNTEVSAISEGVDDVGY
jgi:small redox-active disulfide protein 2